MVKEEINSLKRIANFRKVKIPEYNPGTIFSDVLEPTNLGHECVCGARMYLKRAQVPNHFDPIHGAYCSRSLNKPRLGNWTENALPSCPVCSRTAHVALIRIIDASVVRIRVSSHNMHHTEDKTCPLSNTTVYLENSGPEVLWKVTMIIPRNKIKVLGR